MSGQRFALPYETVVGPTGAPLSGATLTFYLTGSSTLAETYADAGLTTGNPNPVTALSNGRFGDIFLDPSVTYKVVLQDGNGVPQWTADPVQAPGANVSGYATYANIAALRAGTVGQPTPLIYVEAYAGKIPVGGGWFQFVASDKTSADNGGTIIVDASGNRYYRLYYGPCSIENFGAVQDSGLTDNASAINAALANCAAVLVPGSTSGAWYGFSEALTLRPGNQLIGQGKSSVLKANGSFGTGAPLLQNAGTGASSLGARDDGFLIQDLTIDGNSQGSANISLVAATGFRVRGVRLLNGAVGLSLSAVSGNAAVYASNGWVDDLYVYNFSGPALSFTGAAEVVVSSPVIDTCALSSSSWAMQIQAATTTSTVRNIKLVEPIVRNCGASTQSVGIGVDGNGSVGVSEIEVVGGSIDAQLGSGMLYRDINDLQVIGLHIDGPSQYGVVRLSGGSVGVNGFLLDGVKVRGAALDGFYLAGDPDIVLNGCVARSCGRDGVRIDSPSSIFTSIIGGAFINNAGYGVHEISGDNTKVWGSVRNGNTLGKQSLVGASSVCDDVFKSTDLTITVNSGSNALPHGLGMKPKSVKIFLRCVTAELGHSVGDIVENHADAGYGGGNAQSYGASAWAIDATNCGYAFGRDGVNVLTAGPAPYLVNNITPANWVAFVVARGYY